MASSDPELKLLGFVKAYAAAAVATGEAVYKKARTFVPSPLAPYVVTLEDKAAAISAPYVSLATDKAAYALAFADGKVSSVLDYSRELHSKNMGSFSSAKESYFSAVEGAVNATKAALDPQRYVAYATDLGKSVVDTVVAYADPDKLVAAATSAYEKLAGIGPVPKVLELADPLISAGTTQYTKAHDLLVMQPLYKKLYDTAATLPGKAKDTAIFGKVYPLVAPLADPVAANFTNSKVIKQLDEHLKPKTA